MRRTFTCDQPGDTRGAAVREQAYAWRLKKTRVEDKGSVREGRVYRTGDAFTTEADDEIERWLALGYVEKAKKSKASR